ncbi:MAG: 3-deoxy-D-manno-octulosonic acid transferase [Planctomycetaceae bacterium]|jgi:3-deoxy-D-manno-octulosonic-acid transferase|nr:3-deoxy-D-manno-octulosonic acid transferase [Planctomycetaceae bacterium]
MISVLLNFIYFVLLLVLSPVIFYRVVFLKKYREGWTIKLFGQTPNLPPLGKTPHSNACVQKTKRVWLHAVSVGEINLLKPLLCRIAEKHPDWECVISTTSATGFAVAQKNYGANYGVFYAPLDFSWAVRNALWRIKPTMLILAEQEIWPNLLLFCKRQNIPVALINGRLSENGYKRYRKIRGLWRFVMRRLDLVCVQSETYSEWFREIGAKPESIHVVGSLKFDNAQTDRDNPTTQKLRRLANISSSDIVFLAGSTQEPEEELAVETWLALREQYENLRLILVPRHPERFDTVANMLDRRLGNSPKYWRRRSSFHETLSASVVSSAEHSLPNDAINATSNDTANDKANNVPLLVDTVGELGAWWGTSHIAFVGGSMGTRGGQNMLEPAAYNAAVCFGANTKNFRDIVSLMLAENAAVVVHDGVELTQFTARCLADPAFAESLGNRASQLVCRHLGATERTIELLEKLMT